MLAQVKQNKLGPFNASFPLMYFKQYTIYFKKLCFDKVIGRSGTLDHHPFIAHLKTLQKFHEKYTLLESSENECLYCSLNFWCVSENS